MLSCSILIWFSAFVLEFRCDCPEQPGVILARDITHCCHLCHAERSEASLCCNTCLMLSRIVAVIHNIDHGDQHGEEYHDQQNVYSCCGTSLSLNGNGYQAKEGEDPENE